MKTEKSTCETVVAILANVANLAKEFQTAGSRDRKNREFFDGMIDQFKTEGVDLNDRKGLTAGFITALADVWPKNDDGTTMSLDPARNGGWSFPKKGQESKQLGKCTQAQADIAGGVYACLVRVKYHLDKESSSSEDSLDKIAEAINSLIKRVESREELTEAQKGLISLKLKGARAAVDMVQSELA